MEIGLVAAFLGGALALLSPCGALLLPAYFASRVGHGSRRLVHGLVFYLGIAAVLVPLGAGAGVLGQLFATHREAMVIGTAAILVITGIAQAAGWGFDVSRVLPGARSVQTRAASSVGLVRTFLLGAVGGVAGFCAGPILGAVLTVAAAQDDVLAASSLLAAYGAGIVAPMLALAATWDRLGTRGRSVLRGRAFRAFGRMWHSTSVITGALMITLGAAFWATNGLVSAPSLVPADAQASLQAAASSLTGPGADVALIVAATAAALLAWRHVVRRRAASVTATARAMENATAPDAPPEGRSPAGSAHARRDT